MNNDGTFAIVIAIVAVLMVGIVAAVKIGTEHEKTQRVIAKECPVMLQQGVGNE